MSRFLKVLLNCTSGVKTWFNVGEYVFIYCQVQVVLNMKIIKVERKTTNKDPAIPLLSYYFDTVSV